MGGRNWRKGVVKGGRAAARSGQALVKHDPTIQVGRKSSPATLKSILKRISNVTHISEACRAHNIVYSTLRYWIKRSTEGKVGDGWDVEFNGVVDRFHNHYWAAIECGVQKSVDEIMKRGHGYEEVLHHHGHVTYRDDEELVRLGATPGTPEAWLRDENGRPIPETVTKQSEECLMFIAKAHRPEIYGTKVNMTVEKRIGVLVVGTKRDAKNLEDTYGGKQEILDVEFTEVENEEDPAA